LNSISWGRGRAHHTFLAVEEPEAHRHRHLGNVEEDRLTTILTTQSPHIARVAPIRSIVLLRHDPWTNSTVGVVTALVQLTEIDKADLQRAISM
jgi:putative ATP-dependent endonuclease of the OLD family